MKGDGKGSHEINIFFKMLILYINEMDLTWIKIYLSSIDSCFKVIISYKKYKNISDFLAAGH